MKINTTRFSNRMKSLWDSHSVGPVGPLFPSSWALFSHRRGQPLTVEKALFDPLHSSYVEFTKAGILSCLYAASTERKYTLEPSRKGLLRQLLCPTPCNNVGRNVSFYVGQAVKKIIKTILRGGSVVAESPQAWPTPVLFLHSVSLLTGTDP